MCARSGLTIYWRKQFEVPGDDCMYPLIVHAGDVKKITVTHMIGSLQVLGTGLFFSFLVLLFELIFWLGYLLPRRRQEVMKQLASMTGSSTSGSNANVFQMSLAEQQLLLSNTMAGTGFLGWLRNFLNPSQKRRIGSSSGDRQRFLPESNRSTTSIGFGRTSITGGTGGLERPWNVGGHGYQAGAAYPNSIPSQLTYRAKMHPNLYASQYSNMYTNLARDYK